MRKKYTKEKISNLNIIVEGARLKYDPQIIKYETNPETTKPIIIKHEININLQTIGLPENSHSIYFNFDSYLQTFTNKIDDKTKIKID